MKSVLVTVLLLAAAPALAITPVTITGTVLTPDGRPVTTGGTVVCTLRPQPGSLADGSAVAGTQSGTISSAGLVSLTLIANSDIRPAGTTYSCVFTIGGLATRRLTWNVVWQLQNSPATQYIGDIPRLDVIPGLAFGPYMLVQQATPAGACNSLSDLPVFGQDTGKLCRCLLGAWSCVDPAAGGGGGGPQVNVNPSFPCTPGQFGISTLGVPWLCNADGSSVYSLAASASVGDSAASDLNCDGMRCVQVGWETNGSYVTNVTANAPLAASGAGTSNGGTVALSMTDDDVSAAGSKCLLNGGSGGAPAFGTCPGGNAYTTVADEGTTRTARATLNFVGAAISCADNSGAARTDCTVNALPSTGGTYTGQVTSTVATGTAPFVVASTTAVANLNADLLDGSHASAFTTTSHNHTAGAGGAIPEGGLSLSDVTTGNVATTAHGFAPKLPNDATRYLNGQGAWTVPPGAGTRALYQVTLLDPAATADLRKCDGVNNTCVIGWRQAVAATVNAVTCVLDPADTTETAKVTLYRCDHVHGGGSAWGCDAVGAQMNLGNGETTQGSLSVAVAAGQYLALDIDQAPPSTAQQLVCSVVGQ